MELDQPEALSTWESHLRLFSGDGDEKPPKTPKTALVGAFLIDPEPENGRHL